MNIGNTNSSALWIITTEYVTYATEFGRYGPLRITLADGPEIRIFAFRHCETSFRFGSTHGISIVRHS